MTHWDKMEFLINRYDSIYTESSLAQEDFTYLQPFTLMPEGTQRQDYISDRRWKKMRAVFRKYCGTDINDLAMFRPLFIMADIQGRLVNANSMTPLDHKIWQTAARLGKITGGVESPQEQVTILRSLNIGHQYTQLVRMSKSISRTRAKLKKLLYAYEVQDIMGLYKMSKGSIGGERSTLIGDRNHVMAPRLITMHEGAPSFFSFGAGHLAGGKGVLRLLKKAGARIRPI